MKLFLFAAAATVAFAVPTSAQLHDNAGKWAQPTTRAEAEAKAKAYFADRDTNHDGFVTPEEIRAGIEARMGKMQDMAFDRMDTDRNGAISREEFTARRGGPGRPRIAERRIERMSPDGARGGAAPGKREMRVMMMHKDGAGGGHVMMMMMTDTDKDGRISEAEAVSGALKMFDQTDTNRDGMVTMEERHAAMQAWGAKMRARMGDMPPPPPPPAG